MPAPTPGADNLEALHPERARWFRLRTIVSSPLVINNRLADGMAAAVKRQIHENQKGAALRSPHLY
jgi:hypothetical protein